MTIYHTFWKSDNGSFGIEGNETQRVKKLSFLTENGTIQLWTALRDFSKEMDIEALVYIDAKQAMQMSKALRELALRAFEEESK